MRNESNVKSPCGKRVSDLLKERGFHPCIENPEDLEISMVPIELLRHYFSSNMMEMKIQMVKNGEDCYLPKYIFSHVKHGVILNTVEDTEDYLKKIFGTNDLNDRNDG